MGIPVAILPDKTIPSDQQKAYQIIIIKLKHAIAYSVQRGKLSARTQYKIWEFVSHYSRFSRTNIFCYAMEIWIELPTLFHQHSCQCIQNVMTFTYPGIFWWVYYGVDSNSA